MWQLIDKNGLIKTSDTSQGSGSYTATIGDGSSTSIVVTHNLGTRDCVVTTYDLSTFGEVDTEVEFTTTNTITLRYITAPTANQFRVLIQSSTPGTAASLTSPAFLGIPTAPTAAANTNTTQLATTAFVVGQKKTVLSAVSVLEPGISGQTRAGRVLTAADFTTLLGLTTPIGLFNLTDLTNLGTGGALTNKGAVTFGKGITGAATEAAVFTGSAAQALYIADTGAADPFRISYGSWGCWMRTEKRGTGQALISKYTGAQNGWYLFISAANVVTAAVNVSGAAGGAETYATGVTDIADGRWHHVVQTFDGTIISVYVDGVLDVVRAAPGTIFGASSPVNIGASSADAGTAAGSPSFGRVDEAFVTSDVLSAEQIRLLYAYKFAHGATFTPTGVSLMVRRLRKGGPLAVGNFPSQPRRLYNFTAGALTDAGLDAATLTNNGTALVAPGADGALGNAFNFVAASSQYLSATDTGLPAGTAAKSVGCWFKRSATSTGFLVCYGTQDYGIWLGSTAIAFGDWTFGGVPSSVSYNDGQWHFAVFVYNAAASDGLVRKGYVDGKLVAADTSAGSTITLVGANGLNIGRLRSLAANYLDGQTTKTFVTDYALTADEIANLYAVGSLSLGLSPKNEGDHVERVDATNIYLVCDTLESQHQIDLRVAS